MKVFIKSLNFVMALSLILMFTLVIGNVFLRYVFNTGITWAEELSRFLFVWMVFLGIISAMKDNEHLSVDMLVRKLPNVARNAFYVLGNILMISILFLVLIGSWRLTLSSSDAHAPATGISMSFIYGIGIIASIGMIVVILYNMYIRFSKKAGLVSESKELSEFPSDTSNRGSDEK